MIDKYDEAIVAKIKNWVNTDVSVLGPNETSRLFGKRADERNDAALTLPVIAISRDPNITLEYNTRNQITTEGFTLINDGNNVAKVRAIPIDLVYHIDIYARWVKEVAAIVTELIFNNITTEALDVEIERNGIRFKHVCSTYIDNNIADNSDVPERLFNDEFTRWTITLNVNRAYLFSIPKLTCASVGDALLTIKNDDGEIEENEIISE